MAAEDPVFTPKLDPRLAARPMHLVAAAMFGVLFVFFNSLPLRATDLWLHVNYGRWMLDHRAIPAEDPFCPPAQGVAVVDSSWLSQVLLAAVERAGGPEALSTLFAVVAVMTYVVLARAFFLQTRSLGLSLLGTAAVLALGFSRLTTIRPENFGGLLFATLLLLIVACGAFDGRRLGETRPRFLPLWIGTPLLMAAWANLHGSFLTGLAVLGCFFLGSLIEAAVAERSARRALADPLTLRWLGLGAAGAAATLLNPYGPRLLTFAIGFSGNPNLQDLTEWQSLSVVGVGGMEFALSLVGMVVLLRVSRRPVDAAHALLLGLFAIAAAVGVRMIWWYAVVYTAVLLPHLSELLHIAYPSRFSRPESPSPQARPDGEIVLPPGRSFQVSLLCVLAVWVAFALSPTGMRAVGNGVRSPERLYGRETPLGVSAFLREQPPDGLVFTPQWWGDWLIFDGPPGLEPVVTSNVHVIPPEVWRCYQLVRQGLAGWPAVLDRLGVSLLVVDRANQPILAASAERHARWVPVYADAQGVVFLRSKEPAEAADPRPGPAGD